MDVSIRLRFFSMRLPAAFVSRATQTVFSDIHVESQGKAVNFIHAPLSDSDSSRAHGAKISKTSLEIPTFAPYNTHHLCYPKVQVLCFASSVQCQMRRPETVGWLDGNKIRAKLARLSMGTTGSMPSLLCINCRTSKISKMSCSETCLDMPWWLNK